ncbi:hypothetical protein H0H92_000803, partial [Tricholoma furcatifolium]
MAKHTPFARLRRLFSRPQDVPDHNIDSPPRSPTPFQFNYEGPELPAPMQQEQQPEEEPTRREQVLRHPLINGLPCDEDGVFLPEGMPPPPWDHPPPDDFSPFDDRQSFELADLLYRRNQ